MATKSNTDLPTKQERDKWGSARYADLDQRVHRLLALADNLESLLTDSRQCTAQAMKRIADMETRIERAKAVGDHDERCQVNKSTPGKCDCIYGSMIAALEGAAP